MKPSPALEKMRPPNGATISLIAARKLRKPSAAAESSRSAAED
jgi:hypothetical protein